MTKDRKKDVNSLPIFGRDIVDDWSWDREEEEMRESHELESVEETNQNQTGE